VESEKLKVEIIRKIPAISLSSRACLFAVFDFSRFPFPVSRFPFPVSPNS